MTAQITMTQQLDGTWTASIVEGDLTLSYVGASATIQPYSAPVAVSPPPPPPPPAPAPASTNQVKVMVTPSNGTVWTGVATVGNDPAAPSIYLSLADATGKPHPGLTMHAWADGVNVCAGRADNAYGYINCRLQVEYNGASVFDQTVDFHRGVANATIRYGAQAPWHAVDPNLVPVYGTQQGPYDDSRFDHSYNGLGTATTADMSSADERDDIAVFPSWDVPFIAAPSDATFAVVRRAADSSGAWPIYFFDPTTGQPLDVTVHPTATLMSYTQAVFAGNPIVAYGGDYDGDTLDTSKVKWNISGCGRKWDGAHATNYNAAAALATGTARDREHLAFHANAVLMAANPNYYQQSGLFSVHYEERATAWGIRHLFYGAKASSMGAYFQGRLDSECTRATAMIGSNPFGVQGTQFPSPVVHEVKPWEENYTRMSVGLIAHTNAKWVPYAQYLGKALAGFLAHPCWFMSTIYTWRVLDDTGAYYATWDDLVSGTLTAPTVEEGPAWPAADAATMINPATTDEQRWEISKAHGNTSGLGDFWPSSSNAAAPANYISGLHGAVGSLYEFGGLDAAWTRCISTPTQPNWSLNGKHNILPRAA